MQRLPEDMDSKYEFVTLAALRAEQLQAGALPRVAAGGRKSTVIAQEEVSQGLVTPWDPNQQQPDDASSEAEKEE